MKYHFPFNLTIIIIIYLSVGIAFLPTIKGFTVRIASNIDSDLCKGCVVNSNGFPLIKCHMKKCNYQSKPCILVDQKFTKPVFLKANVGMNILLPKLHGPITEDSCYGISGNPWKFDKQDPQSEFCKTKIYCENSTTIITLR
ncbi:hypothetical protein Glove_279g32 [Diversispora epigaea]|uniref:Uncharacterized protein n=1 Tax=Diversispora epigaea TaxID=1348612 RepID=A0A397I7L9_9GLOM|nr:hypothetical protein Glove_279g32 [Diversispora epigaea]